MLENQLEQLGLHKNEVKTYLALFDLGKAKAGQIIEQTGLHRNLVYTALEELIEKKLVSKVDHGGVAMFLVNSPELIQEMVEDKVNIANDVVAELKKKKEEQPHDVIVYEGDDGIKRSRNRVLSYDKGDTLYVIGSKASSTPDMEKYWRKFHTKRIERGIGLKILYEQGVSREDLEWCNKLPLSEARYLPINIDMPIWFSVIKDYLEIGVPGEETLTFGLHSQAAAGAMQKFFDFFWSQKVSTETGVDSLKRNIYEMLNELKPGEEYCVLGASAGDETGGVQELYDKFHQDRIKKGVVTKMLVYRDSFKRIKERFDKCGDAAYKVSLVKTYSTAPGIPMQINMYNGKAFVILYGAEPTVIRFESPEIHDGFKTYFNELWNQETVTTEGFDAFAESWMELFDQLKPGETYRIFGAGFGGGDNQLKYTDFFRELHKKRVARGVKGQLLFHGGAEEVVHKYKMDELYIKDQEFKTLPFNSEFPVEVFFHNDTTLLLIQKKEPTLIKIKNKDVAKSFQNYFDEFWNQETQVLKGGKALQEIWLEAIDYKELRWIGARGYFMDHYPELFKAVEEKARKTPGIKWKNVVDPGVKGHQITKFPWVETKYNLSEVKNPNAIWLYGNKLVISNWAGDEPVIFASTNSQLVQSYNDYFEELWKAKK